MGEAQINIISAAPALQGSAACWTSAQVPAPKTPPLGPLAMGACRSLNVLLGATAAGSFDALAQGPTLHVALGIGLGAKVLVGGGRNQFTLQSLAIEQTKGFGVAAGLGYLYLEKGREGLGKIGA